MKKILFVCTGNTCRSPMAEVLCKKYGEHSRLLSVSSAGIYARDGERASFEAITVMRELGIDLSEHRSRLLLETHVKESDLLLTMTRQHGLFIQQHFPGSAQKVFTLAEYLGQAQCDIIDPFGRGLQAYRESAVQIDVLTKQLTLKLLKSEA